MFLSHDPAPTDLDVHSRAEAESGEHTPHRASRPFRIQLRQEERAENGSFRPAASMYLSEAFRSSGLLLLLPPEELKSLLFLLTFLSPNGRCHAALHQLAQAMRAPAFKVQRRMRRLAAFVWNNQPLVSEQRWESGLTYYDLNPRLIAYENDSQPMTHPTPLASHRDTVLTHSRARYGRPRAEVEREMARMMGWDKEEQAHLEQQAQREKEVETLTPQQRGLLGRLLDVGLTREQALDLLHGYDAVRIGRQLQWLPFRQAKNPAGLLLAAVADDYEMPPALRNQSAAGDSGAGALPLTPLQNHESGESESMLEAITPALSASAVPLPVEESGIHIEPGELSTGQQVDLGIPPQPSSHSHS